MDTQPHVVTFIHYIDWFSRKLKNTTTTQVLKNWYKLKYDTTNTALFQEVLKKN